MHAHTLTHIGKSGENTADPYLSGQWPGKGPGRSARAAWRCGLQSCFPCDFCEGSSAAPEACKGKEGVGGGGHLSTIKTLSAQHLAPRHTHSGAFGYSWASQTKRLTTSPPSKSGAERGKRLVPLARRRTRSVQHAGQTPNPIFLLLLHKWK